MKTLKCDQCKEVIVEDVQSTYNQPCYTFELKVEHRGPWGSRKPSFTVSNIDLCEECGQKLIKKILESMPDIQGMEKLKKLS